MQVLMLICSAPAQVERNSILVLAQDVTGSSKSAKKKAKKKAAAARKAETAENGDTQAATATTASVSSEQAEHEGQNGVTNGSVHGASATDNGEAAKKKKSKGKPQQFSAGQQIKSASDLVD